MCKILSVVVAFFLWALANSTFLGCDSLPLVLIKLFCRPNSFHTIYGPAQFKFDRTRMQQGHDTTHFSFRTHASLHVHKRLVTSNLPCKALVYVLYVCMMHACMSGIHMPNLDCVNANCKPRTAE